MFTRCVALAVLFASGCASTTEFGVETHWVISHEGIARLDLRISGLVAASGGQESSDAEATRLTSSGSERDVEVRIHPISPLIGETSWDFPVIDDPVGFGLDGDHDKFVSAMRALQRTDGAQEGDYMRITARSATIRSTSASEFVVELDDALLDHARAPIPKVTITSMRRSE